MGRNRDSAHATAQVEPEAETEALFSDREDTNV